MTIDWRKEAKSCLRMYLWYMRVGLIAIPFGIVYALIVLHLGHESMPALVLCLVTAIIAVSRIQGLPPTKY
jgi:hypothetical protein